MDIAIAARNGQISAKEQDFYPEREQRMFRLRREEGGHGRGLWIFDRFFRFQSPPSRESASVAS